MPPLTPASGSRFPLPAIPPLRVLVVLASPSDLPRFDTKRLWRQLNEALGSLLQRGSVILEQVAPATEVALKKRLEGGPWHVLHFIGHGRTRSAAQYGTIALAASDGKARGLNAPYFAGLIGAHETIRMVLLQPGEDVGINFAPVAQALTEQGVGAVVTTGLLEDRSQAIFLSKLYTALLLQLTPEAALAEAGTALAAARFATDGLCLSGRETKAALFAPATPPSAPSNAARKAEASDAPVLKSTTPDAAELAAKSDLQRKRAAGQFDVFLCHNSADKPAVKRVAQQLQRLGILPWLDEWELPPGQLWQPLLEDQIGSIKAAAVFVGAAGVGPWQEQEMYGFLREFVARKSPIIPVLLPDAPQAPELPRFLRGITWVNLGLEKPDPVEQLVWGITGQRPNR